MKVRRVIAHARTVVFRFTIKEISGFLAKLLYAVAYVPPSQLQAGLGSLTDVATRPWRSPRQACRQSRNHWASGGMSMINAPHQIPNPGIQAKSSFRCLDSLAERRELYQNRRAKIKRGNTIFFSPFPTGDITHPSLERIAWRHTRPKGC